MLVSLSANVNVPLQCLTMKTEKLCVQLEFALAFEVAFELRECDEC